MWPTVYYKYLTNIVGTILKFVYQTIVTPDLFGVIGNSMEAVKIFFHHFKDTFIS